MDSDNGVQVADVRDLSGEDIVITAPIYWIPPIHRAVCTHHIT